MIWRRLRLSGESSLAEFHHIIQIAMDWDDEYLHQIHIYGKDYRISYDGGFLFSNDASLVLLDDFDFDPGDRFTYTYNFYANCVHDIRIEVTASASQRPHCVSGNGLVSPPRYTEFDLIARFADFNGYHADLQPHRRPRAARADPTAGPASSGRRGRRAGVVTGKDASDSPKPFRSIAIIPPVDVLKCK